MQVRKWAQVAALARCRASMLAFGSREVELQKLAKDLNVGWSTQTLRRALSGLTATERIAAEAGISATALQGFPLAAVEYADRLYRRGPAKAKDAIASLIAGKITVADLKRLEEQGHAADRGAGKALKTRFRKSVELAVVKDAIFAKLQDTIMRNNRRSKIKKGKENLEDPFAIADFVSADQGADTSISPKRFEPIRLAAVTVGPYNDPSLYRTRAFDWSARANALLALYRTVVLILPADCPVEPFLYWRATLRRSDRELVLLHVLADGKNEFLDDHFSGR